MSLRERKKEQTRRTIADAAFALFREQGYDEVTVAEIAAAAQVAPRTVHRYFPDKPEILFADDADLRALIDHVFAQQPADTPPRALLTALLDALADQLEGRRDDLAVRQRLLDANPALHARNAAKLATIERAIAEHLAARWELPLDRDLRPRWWAGVGTASFLAGYHLWLAEGGSLRDRLRAAVALLPTGA